MTSIEAIVHVERSTNAAVLLGKDPDSAYRDLAKLIHPDVVDAAMRARAQEAFLKLGKLHDSILNKPTSAAPAIIGKWLVEGPLAMGDIADLYHVTHLESADLRGVLKIARSPRDGDLIESENFSLKYLATDSHVNSAAFTRYLPKVNATMEASGRRANVLSYATDNLPLSEIVRLVPSLDFRHIIWMVNRSLSIMGFAHTHGIVHGAILPEHLLFGPESHALVLVDWCYSVTAESRKHVPAIAKGRRDFYPPEVFRKIPATPSLDIFMLFATMRSTGVAIPKRFRPFFDWCMGGSPKGRPGDAWECQDRWLALAKEEFGPPTYLKLDIPLT